MRSLRSWAALLRNTPFHPQWLIGSRKVPEGLNDFAGTLLDIGSADRWISKHLGNNTTYIAIDYPDTVSEFYAVKPDIFADACALPLQDSSVDGVVCLEVLEHVQDPADALMEICRVLKPDGRVWISMPFLYPLHNQPYDFQRYTEFGLRRNIDRANLTIISITKSNHSIQASGLIFALSLAGGVYSSRTLIKIILLPIAVSLIFGINIICKAISFVWPDWKSVSTQHYLVAEKTGPVQ